MLHFPFVFSPPPERGESVEKYLLLRPESGNVSPTNSQFKNIYPAPQLGETENLTYLQKKNYFTLQMQRTIIKNLLVSILCVFSFLFGWLLQRDSSVIPNKNVSQVNWVLASVVVVVVVDKLPTK